MRWRGSSLYIACSLFATPNINRWTRAISHAPIHFHLSSLLSKWAHVSHITDPVMRPILEFSPNSLFHTSKTVSLSCAGEALGRLCNISLRPGGLLFDFSTDWVSFRGVCCYYCVRLLFIRWLKLSYIKKELTVPHIFFLNSLVNFSAAK